MIIVFGSINVDLVTKVARIPRPGETVTGDAYQRLPGGKGANQALAARRAGAEVRMLGAVGDDAFAEPALVNLREAGVDLSSVRRTDRPTGVAFIVVDAEGRNAITVAAGANTAVEATAVERLDLGAQDILLLQREIPDAAGESAARSAKAAGARVVLNFAPSGVIPDSYLALVDILILNEHEAADLVSALAIDTGSHAALADALQIRFGTDVVVTLGAAGAVGWSNGIEHRTAALPVNVVDTTGAGDTFVGIFTAALAEGTSFGDALRRGSIAGSLACTCSGAQAGIPTRRAIDAAMNEHPHRG
ncbi:ribokinase [Methylobacterium haplocladii]|uniref:Ribokinase n=1 Tax=Methylobacterium haplocladii TaxID=1176176 RepID=A0A512IRW7_9HYPH|nr:ribokinase [Methylobacterium haplocladii]GEP00444.1 ribokinase [Methylobacterium haplocladii]GJD82535.1 Ribokinase [Methylobacterium haplocladii]GLS59420.1 ribokinase [Methylobacterium haplocladii]